MDGQREGERREDGCRCRFLISPYCSAEKWQHPSHLFRFYSSSAPTSPHPPPPQPRTCQVGGAVCIALPIRVALFDGGGPIAECGGEDGRTMLYQRCADGSVIAGSGTMQWRPGSRRISEREVPVGSTIPPRSPRFSIHLPTGARGGSPAMAVRGVDVGARGDEEVHDGVVGTADGIVQGGDALLIGLAWVVHLGTPEAEGFSLACLPQNPPLGSPNLGEWRRGHLTSFTACCTTSSSPVSAASNSSTSGLRRARRALRGDPTLRSTERISCGPGRGFSKATAQRGK